MSAYIHKTDTLKHSSST